MLFFKCKRGLDISVEITYSVSAVILSIPGDSFAFNESIIIIISFPLTSSKKIKSVVLYKRQSSSTYK